VLVFTSGDEQVSASVAMLESIASASAAATSGA